MSDETIKELIEQANQKALNILLSGDPVWIGVSPAAEVLPGMDKTTILHAGPPIEWERMSVLQRKGIVRGILYEKLADSEEEAKELIHNGTIKIGAANDHSVVGAGVGIVTPSMMVNICEEQQSGVRGYCTVWEGRLGLGTWGVLTDEVRQNLNLINSTIAPALNQVLGECGGIAIKSIIAKGLQMGDETHTRQVAEGLLLAVEVIPHLIKSDLPQNVLMITTDYLLKTDRWFHSMGMASSMSLLKAIGNIEYCTLITSMAGNGVDFGIKVSSLGDRWFKGSSPNITGRYLSTKWGPEDAIPWLGESCVTETVGLGGFAAAAAPLVVNLRGGTLKDAIRQTEEMRAICVGSNQNYLIPTLDLNGLPIGIDIRKILETGITPTLHGGIISKDGGQIGAGTARLPIDCAKEAFYGFAEKYNLLES